MQLFILVTLALAASTVATPVSGAPATGALATGALATRGVPVEVAATAPRDVVVVAVPEGAPADLAKRADRGSYKVSGLGNRKKAILGAGGNTLDLAIAMLETENMSTGYTYGWCPHPRWRATRLPARQTILLLL